MKRKRKFYILMALAAILSTVIIAHAATSAQPGSEFDPLVTKSYVDEQIQKLAEKIGSGKSTGSSKQTGSVDEQVIDNLRTDIRDLTNLIIDAYTKIQSLEKQNLELIQRIQALKAGLWLLKQQKGRWLCLAQARK